MTEVKRADLTGSFFAELLGEAERAIGSDVDADRVSRFAGAAAMHHGRHQSRRPAGGHIAEGHRRLEPTRCRVARRSSAQKRKGRHEHEANN